MTQFSVLEAIWQSSLIVKGVLGLLIILMVVTWALVFYYWKYYKEVERADEEYRKLFEILQITNVNQLENIFQQSVKYTKSSFCAIFQEVYSSLIKLNDCLVASGKGDFLKNSKQLDSSYIERSLDRGSQEFILHLDKYRGYLATISNISPFVGLFGTVWGIIHSFGAIAQGGGSIEAVAPGIAEALVTTAVGIGASIPASWFFNYFHSQLVRQKMRMHNFSLEIHNQFVRVLMSHKE